jgi:hypothetical protein
MTCINKLPIYSARFMPLAHTTGAPAKGRVIAEGKGVKAIRRARRGTHFRGTWMVRNLAMRLRVGSRRRYPARLVLTIACGAFKNKTGMALALCEGNSIDP